MKITDYFSRALINPCRAVVSGRYCASLPAAADPRVVRLEPEGEYAVYSDRAQHTLMDYTYNPGATSQVAALLTGPAPAGVSPPPNSATSFLITYGNGQIHGP
jgi:hypothetical protein